MIFLCIQFQRNDYYFAFLTLTGPITYGDREPFLEPIIELIRTGSLTTLVSHEEPLLIVNYPAYSRLRWFLKGRGLAPAIS